MSEIERLRKELARLKATEKLGEEKRELKSQIWDRKHPNLKISREIFKEGFTKASSGLTKFGKGMSKKSRKRKSHGFRIPTAKDLGL